MKKAIAFGLKRLNPKWLNSSVNRNRDRMGAWLPPALSTVTNMSENPQVVWHSHTVSRSMREQLMGHRGCVLWFTGLSGSGKSTIANEVDRQLHAAGIHSYLLDGDNVRHGLNATPQILAEHGEGYANRFGLGFAPEDREENIRRVGCVAELMSAAGVIVLTAFVSPYLRDRARVRKIVEQAGKTGDFIEIFVDTPLDVCEARDPKGLYKKARAGEIKFFTGIDDPYESPLNPEIHLHSAQHSPTTLAQQVIDYLVQHGKIASR
jgi:adenylylsulfate kinase